MMDTIAVSDSGHEQGKLFVTAIEDKAKWSPNDTFIRYPPPDWEISGYNTITWAQYVQAIDKVAYWLDEQLGKADGNETIAYSGPNDSRYAIIVPAAVKTGRKILIPDGRITEEGLHGLVTSTQCKVWIYCEDDAGGPSISNHPGLEYCALPSLEWILQNKHQHIRYPYEKTFEESSHDVVVIIHTSGTTGVPRPIYQTNGLWTALGTNAIRSQRHWPRGIAHECWMGFNGLNCCAPQWLAGISIMINFPVFADSPCIMLPPDAVGLTPELFKKVLRWNRIDGLKCPPHTVALLYDDPESRVLLKKLKYILFLGAALDRAIGDDLCESIRVSPLIGSTETGDQPSFRPADKILWYSFDFLPENGAKMVKIDPADDGSSDLHELILERPANGKKNIFQAAFWNPMFYDTDRIETKELYAPIKDSDGRTRWVFSARKDDLTKLSWLAKFHAENIESRIQDHPDVNSVLVGGEGRPTPYVIVELKEGVLEAKPKDELLDRLYATVVADVNSVDIEEIRIPRETVFAAKKEKPFKRNLKQVVLRKEVEKDYEHEIEEAYSRLETKGKGATSVL